MPKWRKKSEIDKGEKTDHSVHKWVRINSWFGLTHKYTILFKINLFLDDGQLENLRAYKEINDRLCNVENKTNEQDEIISLQEQRLINLEEQEKKLKNKQKKKSSWFNSLKNFVGNVIGTVGKIYGELKWEK